MASFGGFGRKFGGHGGGMGGGGGGDFGGGMGGMGGMEESEFGGGGFDHNEGIGESTAPTSPSKGGRGGNGIIIQTYLPLTIKQLNSATKTHADDAFRVDGKELNQVTVVGQILSIVTQQANYHLWIDDGTGKIEVRIWLEDEKTDYTARKKNSWKTGAYVRVIGNLRAFMNQRSIMAFRIIPIEDFNEVTFHMLEVIYVHLYNTKQAGRMPAITATSGATTPVRGGAGGSMDRVQNAVLEVIRGYRGENGPNVAYIVRALQGVANEATVRKTLEFLSDEGHIYTTTQEDNYRVTGTM